MNQTETNENASMIGHTGEMSRAAAEKKIALLRKGIIDDKKEIGRLENMIAGGTFKKMTIQQIRQKWDDSDENGREKMIEHRPLFWKQLEESPDNPNPDDPYGELRTILDMSWDLIMEEGNIDLEEIFEEVAAK